ncbi:NfeD family protein [uncultured Alistipes sp.]|jgi:membrane protein implicated in regulation of membrane protease activity|uniref:NfeD family protein n=1 Tax=uncultured Alistipes sp. TaxID=538949 RepID=UPI0025ED58D6|nr:NfeD family protein [uncultured Alistipes sp.]
MELWHIYIIIALIFIIIEIFTSGFAVICFAFGAMGSAIASACDANVKMQLLWFSICTLVAFVAIRPLLLKFFYHRSTAVKTNAEALIGRHAIVSETIDSRSGTGRVAIDGDDWKATAEDNTTIVKGSRVTITKIDSIILTVKQI